MWLPSTAPDCTRTADVHRGDGHEKAHAPQIARLDTSYPEESRADFRWNNTRTRKLSHTTEKEQQCLGQQKKTSYGGCFDRWYKDETYRKEMASTGHTVTDMEQKDSIGAAQPEHKCTTATRKVWERLQGRAEAPSGSTSTLLCRCISAGLP